MDLTNDAFRHRGVVVAGTQSGSGKTLVTAMLLCGLKQRGVAVQPFKVGPDYIDTAYASHFAGRPARNLDRFLMGEAEMLRVAGTHTREAIGVVEGVMGLFDGNRPESAEGSTVDLAELLDWPVLLVLPAAKQGRSIRALARGFLEEAGAGRIAGLVLNQLSSAAHGTYLERALQDLPVPVVGHVTQDPSLIWPERHLGLQAAQEGLTTSLAALAQKAENELALDRILALTRVFPRLAASPTRAEATPSFGTGKTLAVAHDAAFHFYYEENLDALRRWGFRLQWISPLRDEALPSEVDGILLGGGFPEEFAHQLARNRSFLASLQQRIGEGLPCYAECGGLMLLAETLVLKDGTRTAMAGVVPGIIQMTERLQHFGYSQCSFDGPDEAFPAHEFHHSRWEGEAAHANLWTVHKISRAQERREGFRTANLHASYLHLYFPRARPVFEALFGAT